MAYYPLPQYFGVGQKDIKQSSAIQREGQGPFSGQLAMTAVWGNVFMRKYQIDEIWLICNAEHLCPTALGFFIKTAPIQQNDCVQKCRVH